MNKPQPYIDEELQLALAALMEERLRTGDASCVLDLLGDDTVANLLIADDLATHRRGGLSLIGWLKGPR